jgi:hypothetical protein
MYGNNYPVLPSSCGSKPPCGSAPYEILTQLHARIAIESGMRHMPRPHVGRQVIFISLSFVVLLVVSAAPLTAQYAEISGHITDPSGLAVPNANVLVEHEETGGKRAK